MSILWTLSLIIFSVYVIPGNSERTLCASNENGPRSSHLNISVGVNGLLKVNNTRIEVCDPSITRCYTEWVVNKTTGEVDFFEQGCLLRTQGCNSRYCAPSTPITMSHEFCCCTGSNCNVKFRPDPIDTFHRTISKYDSLSAKFNEKVAKQERIRCAVSNMNVRSMMEKEPSLSLSPDGNTMECEPGDFCFTAWRENASQIEITAQACMKLQDQQCDRERCVSNQITDNKYCCCSRDLCNKNFSFVYDPSLYTTEASTPDLKLLDSSYYMYKEKTIVISMVTICSVTFVTIAVFLIYRLYFFSPNTPPDPKKDPETPAMQNFDTGDLKFISVLNQGRYANVCQGILGEQTVAVKVYEAHQHHIYQNERYIYSLPFFDHENLLQMIGADEREALDGVPRYMLVLPYLAQGSLQAYLKAHALDWATFCHMSADVAKGLAHLHQDITKGDIFKPAVAHRDLNTRNILVKDDLTCVISDFGFGIPMMGYKIIKNGQYQIAEQSALQDVGTLRYMAPELLDGATNLRESEVSLKQTDVYALGLVLWELACRCNDLFSGVPLPEYMLPYQKEAGLHPTFEEMQILVSRNKVRPKFPEVWKDYNLAVRALKETIEDCWDHDAEARLTAMCVEERISDMQLLWTLEGKQKGSIPPVTMSNPILSEEKEAKVPPAPATQSEPSAPWLEQVANCQSDCSSAHLLMQSPPNEVAPPNNDRSAPWHREFTDRSSSPTTETLLPAEEVLPQKQSNVTLATWNNMRPYQGRNPTVERNTHKSSDEQLVVSGNTLLHDGKELKVVPATATDASPAFSPSVANNTEELYEGFSTDNQETSLVQNDILSQHRSHPSSFVQNQVQGHSLRPKVANTAVPNVATASREAVPLDAGGSHGRGKGPKLGRLIHPSDISNRIGSLNIFGKKPGKKNLNRKKDTEHVHVNNNFEATATTPLDPGLTEGSMMGHEGQARPMDLLPVQTAVHVKNGAASVQTLNRSLPLDVNQDTTQTHDPSQESHRAPDVQVGIARLEMVPASRGQKVTRPCYSTSDLSPPSSPEGLEHENETQFNSPQDLKRPNSLALHERPYLPGHSDLVWLQVDKKKSCCDAEENVTETKADDNPSEMKGPRPVKIRQRIKTPMAVKPGRFSLYDDRLMSHLEGEGGGARSQVMRPSNSAHEIHTDKNANLLPSAEFV